MSFLQSYVQGKWFVSTALRECSSVAMAGEKYYETIVWTWSQETRRRGDIVMNESSGLSANVAAERHGAICCELIHGSLDDDGA